MDSNMVEIKKPGMTFPLGVGAVVIDLDGTLLDTVADLAGAANRMLEDLGLPTRDLETIKSYVGKGVATLVKRALTGRLDGEPDAALFDRAEAIFHRRYGEGLSVSTQPYHGVEQGLEALKAMGMPLGCITNKAEQFTVPLLEDMGMKHYFQIILSGDSLPKRKPDPMPLLHAAEYFGTPISDLLLIGDSLNDAQAARAAGCHVFVVPYGYNEGRDVRELDVDAIVPSLVEAAKLIKCKA